MKTSFTFPIAIAAIALFASCSKEEFDHLGPATGELRGEEQGLPSDYVYNVNDPSFFEEGAGAAHIIRLELSWRQEDLDAVLLKLRVRAVIELGRLE